jgi:hypothetical protein
MVSLTPQALRLMEFVLPYCPEVATNKRDFVDRAIVALARPFVESKGILLPPDVEKFIEGMKA